MIGTSNLPGVDSSQVIPSYPILIREGTVGDCFVCKSTVNRKYLTGSILQFGSKIGCINKGCKNYYKRDVLSY